MPGLSRRTAIKNDWWKPLSGKPWRRSFDRAGSHLRGEKLTFQRTKSTTCGAVLLLLWTCVSFGASGWGRERILGRGSAFEAGVVTIAVLYPSVGTIKDLVTLRKERLIDIPNLAVVGVYHEREKTDYAKARAYVEAEKIDWLTFHPISAPLSADSLFQKNACSAEFEAIFEQVDGIIFFGGPDIPPYLYHEKTSLLTEITDPYRHFLELSFIFHLLGGSQDANFRPLLEQRNRFPVFGICLGCQSLNVGTGGTLTQDIWSMTYGRSFLEDVIALGPENWHQSPFARLYPHQQLFSYAFHSLKLEPGGKFCMAMGFDQTARPMVLSAHHQQVEQPGRGFRVIATSLDSKVAEAIEHERYANVLGVQFHPEFNILYDLEGRYRFTPEDGEPVSLPAFLAAHPPSLAFHKKIWAWVSAGWKEESRRRGV
jgi:putative glutamine amidotransferase